MKEQRSEPSLGPVNETASMDDVAALFELPAPLSFQHQTARMLERLVCTKGTHTASQDKQQDGSYDPLQFESYAYTARFGNKRYTFALHQQMQVTTTGQVQSTAPKELWVTIQEGIRKTQCVYGEYGEDTSGKGMVVHEYDEWLSGEDRQLVPVPIREEVGPTMLEVMGMYSAAEIFMINGPSQSAAI